jgi:spermidine synthase
MGSNERLEVHNEDARPWLEDSASSYDVIVVDAYRQPYIPFYLTTREFFELVRDRLAPGGSVVVNVGHAPGNDDLERVLGRTMAAAFPTVLRDPVENSNTLLVASEAPTTADHIISRIRRIPPGLQALAATDAGRLEPRLSGGDVYTDDRAPVEWLIDRSILGYASDD